MGEQGTPEFVWEFVQDSAGLEHAAAALAAGTGPLAVDTERAAGYRYSSKAYLVQMYRRGAGIFLFDPIAITTLSPLAAALASEEWVLHAASQDLPCLHEIGLVPQRIFDTELAARLLGFERVALGSLLERLLAVHLEKAHSAADWSTRPLPEPWLEYAALDVAYLPELRTQLATELELQRKSEIAWQEFEAVRTQAPKPAREEPWRRLSGSHRLRTPREFALARELWLARDRLARERDVAPSRLIPDSSVVAAAMMNPRSAHMLAANKEFRGRASRSDLDVWWAAILRGKTSAPPKLHTRRNNSIPHHRSWNQRFPEAGARLAAARDAVAIVAERMNMPSENLLAPETLRQIAWDPPEPLTESRVAERLTQLGARDWQTVATSAMIYEAFVGST